MNKEFKIGLLVFIVFTILILGINYLKGLNILSNNREFFVVYEEIDGLQIGAPVLINGYKVGIVGDIDLKIDTQQHLLVKLNIDKEFDIPLNSVSRIVNQDLMGTKGIRLILGKSSEILSSGDTLISSIESSLQEEVNAQILPLKNKAEELIGSMDSVMTIITAVLNKETRNNLSNSLRSIDKTFDLISKTMENIDNLVSVNNHRISNIIENLESISSNIESNNGQVKTILTNFSAISDSLTKTNIATIFENFNSISKKINNGDGSLGLFMKDDKIYKNLEKSSNELAELIKDIKLHPSRYVKFSILGGSSPYKKDK